MNNERVFSYIEPGGERGEIYEHFLITETELRGEYEWFVDRHLTSGVSFEMWLTRWLNDRSGWEVNDSYPYKDEDAEDTRGCA